MGLFRNQAAAMGFDNRPANAKTQAHTAVPCQVPFA
jgi:hypothetical protein